MTSVNEQTVHLFLLIILYNFWAHYKNHSIHRISGSPKHICQHKINADIIFRGALISFLMKALNDKVRSSALQKETHTPP
jgi:hypothetical protein